MCKILLIYFKKKKCVSAYFKALFFFSQNFRMRAHGSKVFLATNSGYQYSNVSKSLRKQWQDKIIYLYPFNNTVIKYMYVIMSTHVFKSCKPTFDLLTRNICEVRKSPVVAKISRHQPVLAVLVYIVTKQVWIRQDCEK